MGGENSPLFETQRAKGRKLHRVFATTVLVSIIWIWVYRATQQPPSTAVSGGRSWWWTGMFMAELWLGLYWVLTQSVRWNPTYRRTFKQRLSQRLTISRPYPCCFNISC
ncbi:hypothetical protein HanOQP8_Chr08g0295631 [Helianthus annuus]|nr:hypothetical protein HanLR1_Chr08g0288161 [Helianthus annuus]KAJ0723228.1 hypothetical protein HanOQP8_Chr08g0295631 [Helianthus annuus]